MKYIKLTKTTDFDNYLSYGDQDDLNFKMAFSQDIILEPYSKIAFCSLGFEYITTSFLSQATNNGINYVIDATGKGTYENFFTIPLGKYYTEDNDIEFINDLTERINYTFNFNDLTIGREAKFDIVNERLKFYFHYGNIGNGNFEYKNTENNNGVIRATAPIVAPYGNFCFDKHYIAKGTGFFRGTIGDLPVGGKIIIGLSTTPLDSSYPTARIETIKYGVVIEPLIYNYILNGVETVTANGPAVGNTVEIRLDNLTGIEGEEVVIISYHDGANETILTTGERIFNDELYPVIIFTDLQGVISKFTFSSSPFQQSATNTQINSNTDELQYIPFPYGNEEMVFTINIPDDNLRDKVCGFNKPTVSSSRVKQPTISGLYRLFSGGFNSWNLNILLKNFSIESYDIINEQIKNENDQYSRNIKEGSRSQLLYSIMKIKPQGAFAFTYDAPYPIWINLNNKNRIYFRNINIEVVDSLYEIVNFEGEASLTLMIKDKDEV